ncbi:hypothetical protein B0H14DRAFT_3908685 [Mycena olivaceomarginata]|nr:hypothetical protein B0H14DRAFT_3908685 [Mycena olivaceomarginata]
MSELRCSSPYLGRPLLLFHLHLRLESGNASTRKPQDLRKRTLGGGTDVGGRNERGMEDRIEWKEEVELWVEGTEWAGRDRVDVFRDGALCPTAVRPDLVAALRAARRCLSALQRALADSTCARLTRRMELTPATCRPCPQSRLVPALSSWFWARPGTRARLAAGLAPSSRARRRRASPLLRGAAAKRESLPPVRATLGLRRRPRYSGYSCVGGGTFWPPSSVCSPRPRLVTDPRLTLRPPWTSLAQRINAALDVSADFRWPHAARHSLVSSAPSCTSTLLVRFINPYERFRGRKLAGGRRTRSLGLKRCFFSAPHDLACGSLAAARMERGSRAEHLRPPADDERAFTKAPRKPYASRAVAHVAGLSPPLDDVGTLQSPHTLVSGDFAKPHANSYLAPKET